MVEDHLKLLGRKVTDKVTGYEGVVTSISFDLFGCIQAVVVRPADKDGTKDSGEWFDVSRLKVKFASAAVMSQPDFGQGYVAEGNKGPAEKPLPR